ncbi:MAG TPA: SDR family NAD(P)-dependent oxidoreductase [Acidimicrobiales bacterium]|jgi:NAD(P)-dependent dehydrogenase (short-subunit alcohol dehydrogenase family)|nr:SDR family NAD(P)-dependent oxidoreductase [Acidimicrobiales bacterium]
MNDSELRFDGQVAVVTGGGQGLGREHAFLLAERGAHLVVNDVGSDPHGGGQSEDPARRVVEEILAKGGDAVADFHSVATAEGGHAIIDTAMKAHGRIDILVHNAGITDVSGIADLSPDRLDATLDVHLRGAFFVITPAWKYMRAAGYGRIVNVISNAGLFGLPGAPAYSAAKGGLVALTLSLAGEGAPHGIQVNAVAPAAITRLTAGLDAGPLTEWWERWFHPGRVSPVVAWLAHPDCPTTGEIYSAGGGRVARVFTAEVPGYWSDHLSPEDVRDHLADIRAQDGYSMPGSSAEEMALYRKMIPEGGMR